MANTASDTWNAFLHFDALVLQTIILFVVLWVLNKFLFQPYLKYLEDYEKKQSKIEQDYRNIDKLVADAESEKQSILEEARKTGDEIISEAESIASKKRASIMEKADKEASDLLESSKVDIEKERQSMLWQVKWKMLDLVVKLNGKLFDDEKVSKDFLEKSLKDSDFSK